MLMVAEPQSTEVCMKNQALYRQRRDSRDHAISPGPSKQQIMLGRYVFKITRVWKLKVV